MADVAMTRARPGASSPKLLAGLVVVFTLTSGLVPTATAGENADRDGRDTATRVAAPTAPSSLPEAIRLLESCGEGSDAPRVAAALDVVRAAGPGDGRAAETVSALLTYRSPLYRDRDKLGVIRLRAYALATLADLELPAPAPPELLAALVDTLVHIDDTTPSLELAAAARAAGHLGEEGRFFLPHLLYTVFLDTADEPISLERYSPDFPPSEATTAQIEAVRALGRLARPGDTEVVTALERVAGHTGRAQGPTLVAAAGAALTTIHARTPTPTGAPQ